MSSPYTYLWIQDGVPVHRFLEQGPQPLEERLAPLAADPARASEDLVSACARSVTEWLANEPSDASAELGPRLERGLAALEAAHGWRGPLALFLDSLRGAFHAEESGLPCGERLHKEARCWLDADETRPWNGEPLSAGRRLPRLDLLAEAAASPLRAGDTLLVQGWTAAVEAALVLAAQRLERLHELCTEGLPLLDGRRLARRLADQPHLRIELTYDAALTDLCIEADRVWIASESLGASSVLARIGTARLAAECEAEDIPVDWLASASALLPGGELAVPRLLADSLLWSNAPGRVRLRTQWLEELALPPRSRLCTDAGRETFGDLATRALRLECAPRCAPTQTNDWITPPAAPAMKSPARWSDETSIPRRTIR
ncbi:MAG: hypothetical protein ACKO32_14440 [Planctomycetia bacterium]